MSLIAAGFVFGACTAPAKAAFEERPSLIISDETMPDVLYRQGSADSSYAPVPLASGMAPAQRHAPMYAPGAAPVYQGSNVTLDKPFELKRSHKPTAVSGKVDDLADELQDLRRAIEGKAESLNRLNGTTDAIAKDYYALVAGMNAKLQSGTTPGNPDLVESWDAAQVALNALNETASDLSALANTMGDDATRASFLLDETRATFRLSGARDEDHENLAVIEDETNQTIAHLDRLLNQVNDEVNRRTSYLRSERLNMQTLQLAIANGDLYGENIKNRLFKHAQTAGPDHSAPMASSASMAPTLTAAPSGRIINRRPLVIIRFDKPNLQYENALYGAVSEALEQRPNMAFDLVAVSPAASNNAEMALMSTAARKNGEDVLRALTQMGVPLERVSLNTSTSASADFSEVHLYVR